MDFEFTEEQKIFKNAISDFAEKEIAPLVDEAEENGHTPVELFPKMAKLGYLCIRYPLEYGGAGADRVTECIYVEELSRVCAGIAGALLVQSSLGTSPIYNYGSEEQKQEYLLPAIRGEKISSFGLTEPNAGSDVMAIETRAKKEGDSYIINGTKIFITNGPIADYVIVAAYTDKSKKSKGISLFIVDKGTPGFTVSRKLDKLGGRATETAELAFEDCKVSGKKLIGKEGEGLGMIMNTLTGGRIVTGARYLGIGQAAYEAALRYAKERVQFGKPIGKFQAISFKLADMAMDLESARLMIYRAAWMDDNGKKCAKEASMAKVLGTEAAVRVTGEAVQIHGGYGYMMEYPVQRYFRDAKLGTLVEGTSEIQRTIISRELGL